MSGPVDQFYREAQRLLASAEVGGAPTPEPGVACVVWHTDSSDVSVLLGRRRDDLRYRAGYWSFPTAAGARVNPVEEHANRYAAELGLAGWRAAHLLGRAVSAADLPHRLDLAFFAGRTDRADRLLPPEEDAHAELMWVSPDRALDNWRRGEWLLAAETVALLGGLHSAGAAPIAEAELFTRLSSLLLAPDPGVTEIARGVRLCSLLTPTLPPATHTNCYLLGEREVIIVDPGSPYPEEQERVAAFFDGGSESAKPVAIWLTHHHGDHVGGVRMLADRLGVPVAAHPETARLLRDRVVIDEELRDGHLRSLDDGQFRWRCLFTPGHAPGHLCFLEENLRFVVAGDLVAGVGTILIDPDEGDMGAYLESLQSVAGEQPSRLLPAHGDVIPDAPGCLERYRSHRLWREERVVEALRASGPVPTGSLLLEVYRDVPPAVHPLAERSLLSHLLKLCADGRATRRGDDWKLTE